MAFKFENLNALVIDISPSSGEVLGVGGIQQSTRRSMDVFTGRHPGRTAIAPPPSEIIGRTATNPPPPPVINQPRNIEEKKEDALSYCEMLESGEVKLDSHFPQGNKPVYFEERLLFVIKQILTNGKLGDKEILETALKAEFPKETKEDPTILGDFQAAYDDTLIKLYSDSSFARLLLKEE